MNPAELVPSACAAPAPTATVGDVIAVIGKPRESYDWGPFEAAGSIVTTIGKPRSFHLVTTSRPDTNNETDPGEEGDCAGVGWKVDYAGMQVSTGIKWRRKSRKGHENKG